jgi:hypothetical protein
MTGDTAALAKLWDGYARKVYGPDYPLYASLARAVSADEALLARLLECRPEAHDPNMLLAALQYLVLGGIEHPYAQLYTRPSDPPDDAGQWLSTFCSDMWQSIEPLLNSRHVQTNETGRCGGLALGLAAAAQVIGQPLAVIDDGASAGLNLSLDEYLLDFGAWGTIGPADSTVRIECQLDGPVDPDLLAMPEIAARIGIDRSPVDPSDPDAARWMLACVWPGRGRQQRAREALRLAAAHPRRVRRGDMVDDLGGALDEVAPLPTVVVTSWSYSYLTPEMRPPFLEVLRSRRLKQPTAWLCMDLVGTEPLFDPGPVPQSPSGEMPSVLGLATFGDSMVEARALALMHSHGYWIRWLPMSSI